MWGGGGGAAACIGMTSAQVAEELGMARVFYPKSPGMDGYGYRKKGVCGFCHVHRDAMFAENGVKNGRVWESGKGGVRNAIMDPNWN